MAYDEDVARRMRDWLANEDGIAERRMFGGLAFMAHGNMVCGVTGTGGMARVGKDRMDEAMALPGTGEMTFTGRKMGGMVDVAETTLADDALRGEIVALALAYARSLPPK